MILKNDSYDIIWKRMQEEGLEYCKVSLEPVTMIQGRVICADTDRSFVEYEVRCDELGCTSEVTVRYTNEQQTRTLKVERDAQDCWKVNGEARDDLNGAKDIDIGATPSTNVLPIRRLKLEKGQQAAVTAAWVCFPQFTVQPLQQSYERTGDNTYIYRSASGYTAQLNVDQHGVVIDYADQWKAL
ncbi:putative glycolipid-binding domain-containing protein [Paenibacillus alvei]|uniref:putative glycolipid-binding domain-containing protein n=1 Tax=Paenibacillus alvei TaxID=44250 RepID=UPI0018CD324F|nr:putative glycolipid-binding domain-containing protein [Paenibacillus alvei]MBG9733653.1 hypothetical protein [Paenibacillus alvei]MBG9745804.1 hypothetical protein [Paenibacillus alvei]MCY9580353.1 putative glycolipid-binding domain-containing protein [Paenibacillus alvei]MCY9583321.1 putative glycolipid-binding domain-containing protein [Paenibacillus alvei]